MSDDKSNQPTDPEVHTHKQIVDADAEASEPEKRTVVEKVVKALQPVDETATADAPERTPIQADPPWTLQQFFDGEIDLDVELSSRFPSVPAMTAIKFRSLGKQTGREVATIATPDGSAHVIFDADKHTKVVQMSFTVSSMLTLRFTMRELSDMDRQRWLDLMRRQKGGLAFLWGASRWEEDYMICISRRYFTNLYAFSANGYEAAIRLTPEVTTKLLDWLEKLWEVDNNNEDDAASTLLTW